MPSFSWDDEIFSSYGECRADRWGKRRPPALGSTVLKPFCWLVTLASLEGASVKESILDQQVCAQTVIGFKLVHALAQGSV